MEKNFGDENEMPVGLSYIKENHKSVEKTTKRQSLKVEKDAEKTAPNSDPSGPSPSETTGKKVKSKKVKSEVKSDDPTSTEVKKEEPQHELESDDSNSSEEKENEYKRRETRKKNRKMNSVDFSDSDNEIENKDQVGNFKNQGVQAGSDNPVSGSRKILNISTNQKTDLNSPSRLQREATPPPEEVAKKTRQTKIAKNTRQLEKDMKGALTETTPSGGTSSRESAQERHQDWIYTLSSSKIS